MSTKPIGAPRHVLANGNKQRVTIETSRALFRLDKRYRADLGSVQLELKELQGRFSAQGEQLQAAQQALAEKTAQVQKAQQESTRLKGIESAKSRLEQRLLEQAAELQKANERIESLSVQLTRAPAPQPSTSAASKRQTTLPDIAFGAAQWERFFGTVDKEPPLPPNIDQILASPCPINPGSGKTVRETHMLILVPRAVNNQLLTLNLLGVLVTKPREGGATKYSRIDLGQYPDSPPSKAHWVLMTCDVVPGSRGKGYSAQQALVARYKDYKVPHVLDAATAIFMEYYRTGTRLYPNIYIRCREKYDNTNQLVVGGFAPGGLHVGFYFSGDHGSIGAGGLRKF